ncbi:MAG TPA: hypothetical protein EYP10_14455, partial [Armatimonadetes bacterium]|nr:hypothetical protein [Armatimonadota bacterium]
MRQLERALRSRVAILPELSVRGGLTCRAVALGCLLLIANAYWIMAGLMWRQHRPTTVSLFVNVVFTLWILVLLNRAIAHVAPKRALRPQELVIIYAILTLGSAMCSLDFMQPFIAVIAYPIWFATPSNRWDVLLLPHIPTSLVVTDKTALKDYVTGHSSFYYVDTMKAWMTPLVVWGIFMLLLVFGMLALVILLQREWTERARLSYPIVQTPYELIRRDGVLGRKSLWVGFIIAASMNLINGLHELYPSFPAIGGVRFDISPYFTQRPWNAIGWTPLVLLPFGIGLGFLIPLDLALSCWLFYLFWKLERIVTAATGWGDIPNFPYIEEQQFGAYMGLAVASLWVSRSYIATAARAAFAVKHHDNASEANSHIRIAGYSLWAFIACFIGLLIFCLRFGMRLWVASLFFASYYLLSIGITRLRAELGSPVHDLHRGGPNLVMVNAIGTNFLSPRDLSMLSLFHFFNRAYRGHAMPHQLESFKLGQLLHARFRDVGIALA